MSVRVMAPAESGGDVEEVVVRSFRSEDREQVIALHSDATAAALCCNCSSVENVEQVYFGRKHGHFWVAECHGKIIGTLALLLEGEEEIAHLHCLRVLGAWHDVPAVRKQLIKTAATHARDHGSLKLVLHANVQEEKAARFLHRLGFEFSRHRQVDGSPALEFYLNLYQRPEVEEREQ
ncbi:MAG: GNAT family N-acetyltransferase [Phycisphaerae bacterium]